MDKQKFENLMKNKEFLEKILPMKTPEEVQLAFKKEGVEISLEEVEILGSLINKSIETGKETLSEEDLSEIAGGKIGFTYDPYDPTDSVKLVMISSIVSAIANLLILGGYAMGWVSAKYGDKIHNKLFGKKK